MTLARRNHDFRHRVRAAAPRKYLAMLAPRLPMPRKISQSSRPSREMLRHYARELGESRHDDGFTPAAR